MLPPASMVLATETDLDPRNVDSLLRLPAEEFEQQLRRDDERLPAILHTLQQHAAQLEEQERAVTKKLHATPRPITVRVDDRDYPVLVHNGLTVGAVFAAVSRKLSLGQPALWQVDMPERGLLPLFLPDVHEKRLGDISTDPGPRNTVTRPGFEGEHLLRSLTFVRGEETAEFKSAAKVVADSVTVRDTESALCYLPLNNLRENKLVWAEAVGIPQQHLRVFVREQRTRPADMVVRELTDDDTTLAELKVWRECELTLVNGQRIQGVPLFVESHAGELLGVHTSIAVIGVPPNTSGHDLCAQLLRFADHDMHPRGQQHILLQTRPGTPTLSSHVTLLDAARYGETVQQLGLQPLDRLAVQFPLRATNRLPGSDTDTAEKALRTGRVSRLVEQFVGGATARLSVRELDGPTRDVRVSQIMTFGEVKAALDCRYGIPVREQLLVCEGRLLDDNMCADLVMWRKASVHLLRRTGTASTAADVQAGGRVQSPPWQDEEMEVIVKVIGDPMHDTRDTTHRVAIKLSHTHTPHDVATLALQKLQSAVDASAVLVAAQPEHFRIRFATDNTTLLVRDQTLGRQGVLPGDVLCLEEKIEAPKTTDGLSGTVCVRSLRGTSTLCQRLSDTTPIQTVWDRFQANQEVTGLFYHSDRGCHRLQNDKTLGDYCIPMGAVLDVNFLNFRSTMPTYITLPSAMSGAVVWEESERDVVSQAILCRKFIHVVQNFVQKANTQLRQFGECTQSTLESGVLVIDAIGTETAPAAQDV